MVPEHLTHYPPGSVETVSDSAGSEFEHSVRSLRQAVRCLQENNNSGRLDLLPQLLTEAQEELNKLSAEYTPTSLRRGTSLGQRASSGWPGTRLGQSSEESTAASAGLFQGEVDKLQSSLQSTAASSGWSQEESDKLSADCLPNALRRGTRLGQRPISRWSQEGLDRLSAECSPTSPQQGARLRQSSEASAAASSGWSSIRVPTVLSVSTLPTVPCLKANMSPAPACGVTTAPTSPCPTSLTLPGDFMDSARPDSSLPSMSSQSGSLRPPPGRHRQSLATKPSPQFPRLFTANLINVEPIREEDSGSDGWEVQFHSQRSS